MGASADSSALVVEEGRAVLAASAVQAGLVCPVLEPLAVSVVPVVLVVQPVLVVRVAAA